jgi:glycosyltransferase involved in cell wall biosynthesis
MARSAESNRAEHVRPLSCVHYLEACLLEQGGVVQAVLDLSQALAKRGHRITLLTMDAKDAPHDWHHDASAPRIVQLPAGCGGLGLLSRAGLRRAMEFAGQADIVHLHTPWALANRQLARRLQARGIPYVLSIHGMLDAWSMAQKPLKKRIYLALGGRQFLRGAARLHFTAESEKTQAQPRVHRANGRSVVVPLIVDLSSYDFLPGPELAHRAFPAILSDRPLILFLSRLHPKKGVELLISAAAILRQRTVNFQLLIAGPGDDAYRAGLEAEADRQGVRSCVQFLGMVRGQEKLSLYQRANVFALPTHQENFGLVLIEALACGTPVVTTRGTDIWRELEDAGALIVERTAPALATAIEKLLADPAASVRLGEQGRAFVHQWLQPQRVIQQYEQLYADAIRKERAPS